MRVGVARRQLEGKLGAIFRVVDASRQQEYRCGAYLRRRIVGRQIRRAHVLDRCRLHVFGAKRGFGEFRVRFGEFRRRLRGVAVLDRGL
ncbi:MAG TPA: hypothetical protein VFF43_22780, partial [Caldimonas sp.]|nr:hypothetical protein [Caldimonas sp.]